MLSPLRFFTCTVVPVVCALGVTASIGHSQVVADFSDGVGTTSPDQYAGATGLGWDGGWATSAATGTVITTSPLDDGGNYLAVTPSSGNTSSVRRKYTSAGSVVITEPYRISWDWRFDGNMSHLTVFGDRIQFFGDTGSVSSSATTNTWLIGWAAADNGTTTDIFEGSWYLFDNNGSSAFTKTNMFNTGMGLSAGTVYHFTVDVSPTTGTYSASISDGTDTVTGSDLTFRRGAQNVSGLSAYMGFGINRSSDTDNMAFALDSVRVTAIPEPSTYAAWLGLGSLIGLFWRRKSRC